MAASGARTQRPVGSAAWVSTEKENISQLVEQEMEEIEYPVAHEMDWLNEHMAEIFENNNFNFTEVFKTPGKLRGKTPRTARKRNVEDPRMPLSEIFSAAHNQVESRPQASPATKRSPAKTTAPTTTANAKHAPEKASQPQYPTLPQNLNSFSQYNTDSGYHGLERDGDNNNGDDDVVLTQVQPESQASTQPLDSQMWKNETEPDTSPIQEPSTGRRMSESSFHSAREVREATAEPTTIDSNPQKKAGTRHLASQSKQKEPDSSSVPSKPVLEAQTQRSFDKKSAEAEKKPTKKTEQRTEQKQKEAKPGQTRAPKAQPRREPEAEPQSEPERSSPQPEPRSESAEIQKSSPAKTPATQPREPRHEEEEEYDDGGKEDMELDGLDDIGSPSDGSTPERPPIRKSSLTFASLPAREPLKKSLGPRMSRTSHVDIGKVNNSGNPGFLGRQTGGHRTAQAGLDEQAPGDRMDVDDAAGASRESADDETKASKQHNKSSTQRLHEKISMLGKLQPSRPTKSIPSVSGLSSAHVSYPELPTVNKAETKSETANRGSREMPAGETMATDEDEWIKPLNTPQRPNLAKSQTFDVAEKSSRAQDQGLERDTSAAQDQSMDEDRPAKPTESQAGAEMYRKSTTPVHSPPKRPMHQKSASVFNTAGEVSTTPVGSPRNQDAPLSASKWKLQSIMKSAKGLFSSTGSVSSAAKVEASSPDEPREPPAKSSTPTKPEGRKTRGSTEREEKRKQKELEDRQKEEDEEEEEKAREQEKQKAAQLKAAQEKASQEQENERATSVSAPSPKRIPQPQKQPSKEPEPANDASTKSGIPPPASSQQLPQKQNERRPVKPTREPLQKPKPQPVSIRVGSALSRQIPMAPGSNVQESSVPPAPTPASSSKPATVNKKTSNNSLHTVPSNSSFKSSVSSNTQRKAQLASERKKEQEEREARRKEEQKREVERKRAAQQQEEARRQEMRSRAEAERRDRERHERQGSEDPKKAAHMQAIEKRRLENARRLERQGSQQPSEPERPASQASRPASRLGSVQPFNRSVNQPHPNPAKPPKRAMDDEPSNRPAPSKPSTVQPSGETKRRRTEDEHNPPPSVRPTMAPPIRQSNIRKEPKKPSLAGHSKPSMLNSSQSAAHQPGSSIFKTAQPQRPAHPMDMSKYASGKIPFSEVQQSGPSKTPGGSSSQKAAPRPSPKYPSGEHIQLPEIATDSEDEDSDSDMLPVPKWAQPKELEELLRQQEGMEVDSIFGPIAPFSLEENFKSDKRIKKFRERTSSANWSGADRLTQDEIRKDLAERQRLRLNGGWSFEPN